MGMGSRSQNIACYLKCMLPNTIISMCSKIAPPFALRNQNRMRPNGPFIMAGPKGHYAQGSNSPYGKSCTLVYIYTYNLIICFPYKAN